MDDKIEERGTLNKGTSVMVRLPFKKPKSDNILETKYVYKKKASKKQTRVTYR